MGEINKQFGKKGIGVEMLVGVIIAIAVILLIGRFVINSEGGVIKDFVDNLLDFGEENATVMSDSEIILYSIPEDKLVYYDGVDLRDIEKEGIILNGKKIDREKVRKEMADFYYDELNRGSRVIKLGENDYSLLYSIIRNAKLRTYLSKKSTNIDAYLYDLISPPEKDDFLSISRGDVKVYLIKDGDKFPKIDSGLFLVKSDKIVYFFPEGFSGQVEIPINSEGSFKKIYDGTIEWKESIIRKPISISYSLVKDNKEESVKVCLTNSRGLYLVADLSKQATETE